MSRGELTASVSRERLVGACAIRLSYLAAWRLVELDGPLSLPVRWYALTEPDAAWLAVWAGSDAP